MSADADTTESQFQKIGDIVERNDDTGLMQVESLCMNCHENGTTRLLLLRVPFFRDLILESFECPHCFFKNNSIKSAGQIQELGCKYTLEVENAEDLQRQVVRSDVAVFKIESLGIEMPKEGQLTTVEGLVQRIHESLSSEQPLRKVQAPEVHDALVPLIQKLEDYLNGTGFPFTISLDDYTGNSWIAPNTADKGNKYKRSEYPRTQAQNEELGLSSDAQPAGIKRVDGFGDPEDLDLVDGVYSLPANCPGCAKDCEVNMQKISIPHFKEVFIWATVCPHCGYKSNEVKTGGAIPEKGTRITLSVQNEVDLNRDVLKSNSCSMYSEELELEVQSGTLGSRFTTIEGILTEIRDQLTSTIFDVEDTARQGGDSMPGEEKSKWDSFFARLEKAISGELKFTITLVDPLSNSYVQDLCAPAADPQLTVEEYTRTEEEEEEFGLKDMKTEGYEQDAEDKQQ
ncbi:nucleolar zinc-finger protein [Aspergillus niger]|uniref:ZPR1 zinc-finger domain-domain-containing protein n=1 Tax=Aspergillus welwitschiae TaxID=1341132 RepID=A0A3F3PV96_9EURO|nr:ZPR1 zinc-finger domain-domain-containing protein [Aspergillus welwitschiae]RDH30860.1 ZPR1 zinc-finger domain-domain-containing protein [Aspergillus welwitschiae]GLA05292.1 nucleolar zinc-finger protein [Aspergillus niger]GLA14352.1 nucleolar zinc-finger protein [Aspergillus niger]GLA42443.1 nucleolar zinc-finger protein [Aspergillus niger]